MLRVVRIGVVGVLVGLLATTHVLAQATAQINVSNPNFGRYLAADEPRIMQFAVKYQF